MNNLPKETLNRIISTAALILIAVAGIWFGLIQPQRVGLINKAKLLSETQAKLKTVGRELSLMGKTKEDLASARQNLDSIEGRMPSGDLYRWTIRTFTSMQTNKVEIAAFEPPRLGASNILPKVPCEAVNFSVSGTGYYTDFGSFLANLENSFPHMRLQRLELQPTQFGEATTAEQERLNFKLEIVALVKPAAAEPRQIH